VVVGLATPGRGGVLVVVAAISQMLLGSTALNAIVIVFALLAFAAWLSAAIHGFWSLAHLSGKNSAGQMLVHGVRWYDAENFTPRGQQLQRRFVRSFVAFFGCILGLMLVAILTSSSRM
jgi:hypothetical protein